METQEKKDKSKVTLERVVGIIFLIPPVLGVIFFIFNVFVNRVGDLAELYNLSPEWTGNHSVKGGGYMSAAPIYLGLMAIAGAMLLKDSKK
jgi:hypothetical protein